VVTCSLREHPACILEVALFQSFWPRQSENRGRHGDVNDFRGREKAGEPTFMAQGHRECGRP